MGPAERLRYWGEQLLSTKSLVAAGTAAAGLVGWVTTQNPAFGWLMLGGAGAWTATMYYLGMTGSGDKLLYPQRGDAIKEVEFGDQALHHAAQRGRPGPVAAARDPAAAHRRSGAPDPDRPAFHLQRGQSAQPRAAARGERVRRPGGRALAAPPAADPGPGEQPAEAGRGRAAEPDPAAPGLERAGAGGAGGADLAQARARGPDRALDGGPAPDRDRTRPDRDVPAGGGLRPRGDSDQRQRAHRAPQDAGRSARKLVEELERRIDESVG